MNDDNGQSNQAVAGWGCTIMYQHAVTARLFPYPWGKEEQAIAGGVGAQIAVVLVASANLRVIQN